MKLLFSGLTALGLIFLAIIVDTIVGGVVGWCVGLVFPFIVDTLNTFAKTSLTGFELGAVLGFVGSFIKSKS